MASGLALVGLGLENYHATLKFGASDAWGNENPGVFLCLKRGWGRLAFTCFPEIRPPEKLKPRPHLS